MSETDEVFIIEEDDLEEGEITDDSDSDIKVVFKNFKPKSLPKHYSFSDKKVSNEKHKKDCKHAHHLNHKIKDRNKSTLSNVEYKKHKSSCPRQKSSTGKVVSKKHTTLPNHTKFLNNHNSSFKSAFRNFTSPPRPVLQKTSPNGKNDFSNDSYPELLLAYKKSREHLTHKNKSSDFGYRHKYSPFKKSPKHSLNDSSFLKSNSHSPSEKSSSTKVDAKPHLTESVTDIANENDPPLIENAVVSQTVQYVPEPCTASIEEDPVEEESEDEEELRRIALATFVARTGARQKVSGSSNSSVTNSPTHSLSNQSSSTLIVNGYNNHDIIDNHEVVDMDLGGNSDDDAHSNLFVIDNQPVMPSEFDQYMFYGDSYLNFNNLATKNCLPPQQPLQPTMNNLSESLQKIAEQNAEIEEAILRAEVLESMYAKKKAVADKRPEIENISVSVSTQDQFCKPPFSSEGHLLNPFEANAKKIEVVKLSNSKFPNSKAPVPKPRNINATQNRLVITLNNDSSSEESDNAEDLGNISQPENVVASIDALISSARQKSDIKTNGANLNNVSCLSKAQQEEYKKLRNILAEKEPMTIIPQVVKEKIAAEHQNLNFLANKINVAKEKLGKEVEVLVNTENEVLNKKKAYISSKLKFQHLQEQLHAAKLTKTANLKTWKVFEAKLVNAKSVVTKQKALIAMLETELNNRRLQFEQNSSSPLIQ